MSEQAPEGNDGTVMVLRTWAEAEVTHAPGYDEQES
jgi:hypothetical protein